MLPRAALIWALACLFTPVALAEDPAVPAVSPGGEEVEYVTGDQVTMHADLYRADDPKAPSVLLLHEHRKDRTTWAPLIPALTEAGFNVVAFDLRGHGGSTRQMRGEREGVLDADEVPLFMTRSLISHSPKDVGATIDMLAERGLPTDRLALIGAGYGASAALLASPHWHGQIWALVLMSPVTGSFGIQVLPHAKMFPGRMLLIVDRADPTAAPSSHRIVQIHPGAEVHVELQEAGRGTHILLTYPELKDRIVEFLQAAFGAS
jgi:pimeloyl-ACP methyl ester carboxylesterase